MIIIVLVLVLVKLLRKSPTPQPRVRNTPRSVRRSALISIGVVASIVLLFV